MSEIKRLGNLYGEQFGTGYAGNVYNSEGLSPAFTTFQGGGREPHILEVNKAKKKRKDGCTNSVTTAQKYIDVSDKLKEWIWEIDGELYLIRIRKLTPKECWRLMGFSDEDFEKAESVNSNTQLYKQAGNSIVKNVLMGIFYEMFKDETEMNPCLNCNWNCNEEDKKCNEYHYVQKLKSKERE